MRPVVARLHVLPYSSRRIVTSALEKGLAARIVNRSRDV